jgi:CheY-like chemotaxis protein
LRRVHPVGHDEDVSSHGTILVVDDDDDTRRCVALVLESEGYEVHVASNGRIALDILLAGTLDPDLVLLDLMMPVMSGWDVLKAVEEVPRLAALPIAVFTAAGTPIEALTRPVVRKPIDLDLLLGLVEGYCRAGWVIEEPPSDLMPKRPGRSMAGAPRGTG